jgi:hypothetical protein
MGHHHHIEVTSTKPYEFTSRNKIVSGSMIAIGLIAVIAQFATGSNQITGNLLMNNFMFMGIGLCATFFLAIQYVAEVGWSAVVKRPMEAIGQVLPVAGIIMILIIALGGHSLYHWMDAGITDPKAPNYDAIIAGKSAFLNPMFFWIRIILYFVIWSYFAKLFRKNSLLSDQGDGVALWKKNRRNAATFLVLFAVTESLMSWDFVMSIDTHWYSTLFAWYSFAGLFVTSIAVLVFTVTYLKSKGYLPEVTEHHLHDLGKFMFAFSIFWTYLWFCQFMLIWYSNIPEEITYFMVRQDHYRGLWLASFFINFLAPFIVMMSRDAKRKLYLLMGMSIVIFIGHWIDTYIMVIPGSIVTASHHAGAAAAEHGAHAAHGAEHAFAVGHIGLMEIGTTIGFIGLLMYVVQFYLSKAPLVAKNHPMMEESLHHAI